MGSNRPALDRYRRGGGDLESLTLLERRPPFTSACRLSSYHKCYSTILAVILLSIPCIFQRYNISLTCSYIPLPSVLQYNSRQRPAETCQLPLRVLRPHPPTTSKLDNSISPREREELTRACLGPD